MVTKKTKRVPIFPCTLNIVIVDVFEELKAYYPTASQGCDGCVIDFEDGYLRIVMLSTSGVLTTVHESEHIKNRIFKFIGQESICDNDETDAYLLEWIVLEIEKVKQKHIENGRKTKNNGKKGKSNRTPSKKG